MLMETVEPAELAALARAAPGRERVKMYRRLAAKYHPDTHYLGASISNEEATSDFQEIGNLNDKLMKREEKAALASQQQPDPQKRQRKRKTAWSKTGKKANSQRNAKSEEEKEDAIREKFNKHYQQRSSSLDKLMSAESIKELLEEYGSFCYDWYGDLRGYWVYRNAKKIMLDVMKKGRYNINYDVINNFGVKNNFIRSKFQVIVSAFGAVKTDDKLLFIDFFRKGLKHISTDDHIEKYRAKYNYLLDKIDDVIKDRKMTDNEKKDFYRNKALKHFTNLDTSYNIVGKFKYLFLR